MRPKNYSLESYALFAATILGSDKLKSQIITQNYEPDLRLMNWSGYADDINPIIIDIDGNGIFDLEFDYNYDDDNANISLDINDCVIGVGVESFSNWDVYNIEFLNSGQLIGESIDWAHVGNRILKGSCQTTNYYGSSSWASYTPLPFISKYLPIKLQIDAEVHYGWVRLSINRLGISTNCWYGTGSPLTIFSISYNSIANDPLSCFENIITDPESNYYARLSDVLDTETIKDLAFVFDAETPDYSEIRFYLTPNREDMVNFSTVDALLLDPSRYFSIPAGEVIPGVENKFNLPETLLDINGNGFVPDMYYSGYYMKMPLVGETLDLTLSTPMNIARTYLTHCYLNVNPIEMEFIINKGCFQVSFSKDFDGADIGSYGVGLVNSNNIEDIEEYYSGYQLIDTTALVTTPKTFANEYAVDLIGLNKDIFGDNLIAGDEYAPVVVGFGDGYNRDLFCYNLTHEFIVLPFVTEEDIHIFYYDNTLSVDVLPEMISNCKLEIVSVIGQKILAAEITQEKTTLDLSRLPKGIYLAVIYQNNTKTEIHKFEKN